jgi:hypothetical protein
MDYDWKNEDNVKSNMLHAKEVLEAVKQSTQCIDQVRY